MKYGRRIIISVFWILLGSALIGCSAFDVIDSFWSGMGGGLVAVGIMQTIKFIKYHTNEEYREKVNVANSDERNKFLAGRAWAWSGYIFVMIMSVATIGLRIAGFNELSTFAGGAVCLILILYWISFLILRKKY